ncbi:SGNH/GDSL hydrolase family protein [Xylanimonas oleitrophica]|uniref:SGNH/GDSL hydrolase family protein n=1 Tax=Xylanimonas oleitrophica TaxID=2607479 RepID=A0A2W5X308_9MICO|nr:SGNH/GDSL hydrolase family protein [Xylanimonas oleitrophica]PZR55316.1 SGNH/GDSL hydrolase family protein [Xylanimonas oleitrophica]
MRRAHRRAARLISLLAAAGLTATATAATPATAVSASAAEEPARYVAMGDSFSAGSGVWPPDRSAPAICLRSTASYPRIIATTTGAVLADVTCGGADTADLARAQYPGLVRPQFDALSEDTDLVTITIGGNDSNVFVGALLACAAKGATTAGYGNPCQRWYGSHFHDVVRSTTYPAVRQALTDIHARAPHAQVAILGYPWILPAQEGCYTKMPVARGDVPYLRDLQATLNGVIAQAAAETGTTFVDLSEASEGRDACAPAGTRWVEPVLWGTSAVPVHPNALGASEMAAEAMRVLGL